MKPLAFKACVLISIQAFTVNAIAHEAIAGKSRKCDLAGSITISNSKSISPRKSLRINDRLLILPKKNNFSEVFELAFNENTGIPSYKALCLDATIKQDPSSKVDTLTCNYLDGDMHSLQISPIAEGFTSGINETECKKRLSSYSYGRANDHDMACKGNGDSAGKVSMNHHGYHCVYAWAIDPFQKEGDGGGSGGGNGH